jgi:hypothetical protein
MPLNCLLIIGRMRINDLTNDDNILLESKENKEVNLILSGYSM